MKYPVFHYSDFTYIFIPSHIKITNNILDQIDEVRVICSIKYPLFIFVGIEKCYIYINNEIEEIKNIQISKIIPEKHDLIYFPKEDSLQYDITYDKITKSSFKIQMENILANIPPTMDTIVVKYEQWRKN